VRSEQEAAQVTALETQILEGEEIVVAGAERGLRAVPETAEGRDMAAKKIYLLAFFTIDNMLTCQKYFCA